jgi:hypothetical protein
MLKSKVPVKSAATRRADKVAPGKSPLVSSLTAAKREAAGLRRGRERLEDQAETADTSVRSSLI